MYKDPRDPEDRIADEIIDALNDALEPFDSSVDDLEYYIKTHSLKHAISELACHLASQPQKRKPR